MNFLQNIQFEMNIERLPEVEFSVTKCNVPGISAEPAEQSTPFKPLGNLADTLSYDNLSVTCLVDEYMKSWLTVYDWLKFGTPTSFEEFNTAKYRGSHTLDIDLLIMSNSKNPIIRMEYKNCFPISVSSIDLDTQQSTPVPASFNIDFRYDSLKPIRL